MSDQDAVEFTPVEYVCKGRRLDRDDCTLHVILTPQEGRDQFYNLAPGKVGANIRWLKCGSRYEIPTSGTTITAAKAKYLGPCEDRDQVKAWQLETDAAEAELEMLKAHKRADDRGELLTALLPFRKQYQKTIGTARKTALELALLAALRTPPRSHES